MCNNSTVQSDHEQATSKYICYVLMLIVETKLDITPQQIRHQIRDSNFINMAYRREWHACTVALLKIFRVWEKSYETLPQYMDAIQRTNPGTAWKLTQNGGKGGGVFQFTGLFWAFRPSIKGSKYCQPVLSVDQTHLQGKYSGVLLFATKVDADGGLYPLFLQLSRLRMKHFEFGFSLLCIP